MHLEMLFGIPFELSFEMHFDIPVEIPLETPFELSLEMHLEMLPAMPLGIHSEKVLKYFWKYFITVTPPSTSLSSFSLVL